MTNNTKLVKSIPQYLQVKLYLQDTPSPHQKATNVALQIYILKEQQKNTQKNKSMDKFTVGSPEGQQKPGF